MNEKKNNLLRKLEALIFASEKALHLKVTQRSDEVATPPMDIQRSTT